MLPLWVLRQRPPDVAERARRIRDGLGGVVGTPPQPSPPSPPSPPTAPVPPGGIGTRFGSPPDRVADAIQSAFPAYAWTAAAEIAYEESGWRVTAVADTRWRAGGQCGIAYPLPNGQIASTEYSVGLFQINICAHGGTLTQWMDPYANAAKAAALWRGRGELWTDWWISAGKLGLPR